MRVRVRVETNIHAYVHACKWTEVKIYRVCTRDSSRYVKRNFRNFSNDHPPPNDSFVGVNIVVDARLNRALIVAAPIVEAYSTDRYRRRFRGCASALFAPNNRNYLGTTLSRMNHANLAQRTCYLTLPRAFRCLVRGRIIRDARIDSNSQITRAPPRCDSTLVRSCAIPIGRFDAQRAKNSIDDRFERSLDSTEENRDAFLNIRERGSPRYRSFEAFFFCTLEYIR